ncbi:sigma 54-interacting transcriptional regulator [Clostridium aestuarii]|uniref:HTH-type transcriptional regulatory protein TyrR n=1 Tax=Clostridium aestuarii TaxID=338193 RepID=A0ABT4D1T6_9CLOT|nr:sigma 54-interacting transcriptional regulator [Clostridium aestuarii]MCY6485204.1 sigma 54-interacting transcriptional regulator [Clostridium aestuarii]
MKEWIRFEVTTINKVGMALQILNEICKYKIDIDSLEVFFAKTIVKIEQVDNDKKEQLIANIKRLDGVIDIREVGLLEYEKNERKTLAFIDSVDEGILAVNKNLEIEIFNSYCEEMFHCKREEVLGENVKKLLKSDSPMITLMKTGEKYDNIEVYLKNSRGESHYLTTGRPINDDNGHTIGAVASIRDIKKAIELANVVSSTEEGAFSGIIGNSPAIEKVKKMSTAVAKSNSTILLRGDSGTGKEVFARAIQSLSNRKNKKFVTINCAALPDNLIESELFGYEKGSFTGASNTGKDGLFKEANEGTLFLDEIGELSIVLQAKLLRVLQEGVIRKIGSTKEEKVDVRIIAATNRNLEKMIRDGEFREDLYYRLNVIPIYIPPLKERLEDITALVSFFINKLNKTTNKNISGANLQFIKELMNYDWPGNIRELQNVVERAMNLCEGRILILDNLIINFEHKSKVKSNNYEPPKELKLKEIVEIHEKEAIINGLEKYKSCRKVAKALGVSHTTIINKIKKYNIKWKE